MDTTAVLYTAVFGKNHSLNFIPRNALLG